MPNMGESGGMSVSANYAHLVRRLTDISAGITPGADPSPPKRQRSHADSAQVTRLVDEQRHIAAGTDEERAPPSVKERRFARKRLDASTRARRRASIRRTIRAHDVAMVLFADDDDCAAVDEDDVPLDVVMSSVDDEDPITQREEARARLVAEVCATPASSPDRRTPPPADSMPVDVPMRHVRRASASRLSAYQVRQYARTWLRDTRFLLAFLAASTSAQSRRAVFVRLATLVAAAKYYPYGDDEVESELRATLTAVAAVLHAAHPTDALWQSDVDERIARITHVLGERYVAVVDQ